VNKKIKRADQILPEVYGTTLTPNVQLYHAENKLHFEEMMLMMMVLALY
jgi:hypothetical protein